jgi:acetyl esterase/lipase
MVSLQIPFVLEPAARELSGATSKSLFFFELEPGAARNVLDELLAASIDKLPIDEEWLTAPAPDGDERVRIVKPRDVTGTSPVLVYTHGGGWALGNRLSAAAQCRTGGLVG